MISPSKSILETIGRTPLVEISNRLNKGGARVLAKVESFNPGGSVKDRVARAMIDAAEKNGTLKPGMNTIEVDFGGMQNGESIEYSDFFQRLQYGVWGEE